MVLYPSLYRSVSVFRIVRISVEEIRDNSKITSSSNFVSELPVGLSRRCQCSMVEKVHIKNQHQLHQHAAIGGLMGYHNFSNGNMALWSCMWGRSRLNKHVFSNNKSTQKSHNFRLPKRPQTLSILTRKKKRNSYRFRSTLSKHYTCTI